MKKQPDINDWPSYASVAHLLLLTGRATTPQEATAMAREFWAASFDWPTTKDATADIETELSWWVERFAVGAT